MLGKLLGILLRKLLREWWRGQNYLRKTVIGGEPTNQKVAWEIDGKIAWEIAQDFARGMVEGTKLFKKDSDWWKCSI